MHNALRCGQAYSCSLKLFGAVQPLKYAEELVRVLHVEANAVIGNKINVLAVLELRPDFNLWVVRSAGVLDRVGKKIHPHLLQ
jgi:hypothetical protein